MAEGYFVGVGVATYARGHEELAWAVPDVDGFRRLLGGDFDGEPQRNPTKAQITGYLDALPRALAGVTSLVLLWSGSPSSVVSAARARSSSRSSAACALSPVSRRCGRSGIKLPAVSLGLWQNFGDDRPLTTQ